jgi:hypothetical protein
MKGSVKYILMVGLLLTLSCSKEAENSITDYRDKFCGVFSFDIIDWNYCINSPYKEFPSTWLGRIEKINDSDSLILITYKEGRNRIICSGDSVFGAYIKPRVDSVGKLNYRVACAVNSKFSGYFAGTDTVRINITEGGMGCNSGQSIVGVRQN